MQPPGCFLAMYTIVKQFEISASHQLALPYESPCCRPHGHNWQITVCCRAEELDANGMVTDMSVIKRDVQDALDHRYLNDVLPGNPTSENLARWICERIPHCVRVEVRETAGNLVIYEKDGR